MNFALCTSMNYDKRIYPSVRKEREKNIELKNTVSCGKTVSVTEQKEKKTEII